MATATPLRKPMRPKTRTFARRLRIFAPIFAGIGRTSSRKRVYVSYTHAGDAGFKRFLETWDTDTDFRFIFSRHPSGMSIMSEAARPVKATITRTMRRAEYLLVIVGENTHLDEWVTWEVTRAQQHGIELKVAGVKISNEFQPPAGMPETSWAAGFTKHSILAALKDAGRG